MSSLMRATSLVCLLTLLIVFSSASPAPAEYFWPSAQLPPPILQSPADDPVIYEDTGIIAGNVRLSHPSAMFDLPPGGLPTMQSLYDVSMDVSLDGGRTFVTYTSSANVRMRATELPIVPPSPVRAFDTEMLALDISGGTLPAGVVIRESPPPFLGLTSMTPTFLGGFWVNSHIDVMTELSLDGGQTWDEASAGLHFEGIPEPATVTLLATGGLGLLAYAWRRRRGA